MRRNSHAPVDRVPWRRGGPIPRAFTDARRLSVLRVAFAAGDETRAAAIGDVGPQPLHRDDILLETDKNGRYWTAGCSGKERRCFLAPAGRKPGARHPDPDRLSKKGKIAYRPAQLLHRRKMAENIKEF